MKINFINNKQIIYLALNLILVLFLSLSQLLLPNIPPQAKAASTYDECMARSNLDVVSGTYYDKVKYNTYSNNLTIDARDGISLTSGTRALEVGDASGASGLCVIGWSVYGQQSRTLSWREMHDVIKGSALRVVGSNYVVDGLRAENVEDAFDPRGGENFEVRNMWVEYIRDDCIENDELRQGYVKDSLFDGCYTFFSEQDTGSAVGETLVFDNVLVRLQPMPGPNKFVNASDLGHGSFFKKFHYGGRHEPLIRNSIFYLEEDCYNGCSDWPAGTVAENVTIVWKGQGDFPMSILPGMTLTTDLSVWNNAVADWKQRHGCTTIDKPCTRLHNPTPPPNNPAGLPADTTNPGSTPAPAPRIISDNTTTYSPFNNLGDPSITVDPAQITGCSDDRPFNEETGKCGESSCGDGTDVNNCGIVKTFDSIINVLAMLVAPIVALVIVFGGIQYIQAQGNPQATLVARNMIIKGLIAFVGSIFIYSFLQWLIPGGIF